MAKLKTGRHTSALKANRQSEKRASQNRGVKKSIKTITKEVLAGKSPESLKKASSVLDKAAKKNVIHWKTAARKKSRLAKITNKTK